MRSPRQSTPAPPPQSDEQAQSFARERRSQLRGLLLLALAALAFLVYRARPLLLFPAGWWRL